MVYLTIITILVLSKLFRSGRAALHQQNGSGDCHPKGQINEPLLLNKRVSGHHSSTGKSQISLIAATAVQRRVFLMVSMPYARKSRVIAAVSALQ